jgi:uncharacterized protein YdhG (YjbR/CyaY superfamily)
MATGRETVEGYIAAQPEPARPALERVRATIRKALPGAEEGISYQIPVYRLEGRAVLYFAGFQRHYSIYPATGHVVAALGAELAGRVHSKATIRFTYDGPVPVRLIARVARLRAQEVAELGAAKAAREAKAGPKPRGRGSKAAPRSSGRPRHRTTRR